MRKYSIVLFFLLLQSLTLSTIVAAPSTLLSKDIFQTEQTTLLYDAGRLILKGFEGSGTLHIYSIIGNEIAVIEVLDLSDFTVPLDFKTNHMYIVRVQTDKGIKTFKLVAKE